MRLLLLTGIFRSGTTLLGNVLRLHPGVCMAWQPYGPFFKSVRNHFARDNDATFDVGRPMGIDWLQTPVLRERFLNIFKDVVFDAPRLAQLRLELGAYLEQDDAGSVNAGLKPAGILERLDALRPGNAGEILMQLLTLLMPQAAAETTVCGFKEVFIEEFIAPLCHSFGSKCHCVHILRDPRAVAYSRNNGLFRKQTGTMYPMAFIAEAWNRSAALARVHSTIPGVGVVRYEDLVQFPENTLKELLRETGLNTPEQNGMPWNKLEELNTSNSSFQMKGEGISTTSLNKWQQDSAAADYFENACADGMTNWDYVPMHHEQHLPLHEDKTLFPRWLQSYYQPVDIPA